MKTLAKFKKSVSILLITLFMAGAISSCAIHLGRKHLPPGQAKKVHGTKSAKPFAPGQQKKHRGHKHK